MAAGGWIAWVVVYVRAGDLLLVALGCIGISLSLGGIFMARMLDRL